jgi:ribosome maturation factor RimP
VTGNSTALHAVALELAVREGLELVGAGRQLVRITIHRAGGVTIKDCRRFSDTLRIIIEAEGTIRGDFALEVSSPGITRLLKSAADFVRSRGAMVELFLRGGEGTRPVEGVVDDVRDDSVILRTGDTVVAVPLADIRQARPVIDWRELMRKGEKKGHPERNTDE